MFNDQYTYYYKSFYKFIIQFIRFIEKDISPMKTAQKRKYNLVWFYVLHLSRKRYII